MTCNMLIDVTHGVSVTDITGGIHVPDGIDVTGIDAICRPV